MNDSDRMSMVLARLGLQEYPGRLMYHTGGVVTAQITLEEATRIADLIEKHVPAPPRFKRGDRVYLTPEGSEAQFGLVVDVEIEDDGTVIYWACPDSYPRDPEEFSAWDVYAPEENPGDAEEVPK